MQVPALLYGDPRKVQRRCKAALQECLAGAPYVPALESAGMLDVGDMATPIKLEFSRDDYRWGPDWGLYLAAPTFLLFGEKGMLTQKGAFGWWTSDRVSAVFEASMTRPWALLSLISTQNAHLLFGTVPDPRLDRYRMYVASVLRDCAEMEAVGARYTTVGEMRPLSRLAFTFYVGLVELGATSGHIQEILAAYPYESSDGPPGGLRSIVTPLGITIDPAWAAPRLPDHPSVLVPPPAPPPPPPSDAEVWMSPAMQAAIEADDQEEVKHLISLGEDPQRLHPNDLYTPLAWAIQHGHSALVAWLLDHGASVKEVGQEGESPLMMASFHGHDEIVRLLLAQGASVRYRTDNGWDARGYAKLGGHATTQEIIAQAGKRPRRQPPVRTDLLPPDTHPAEGVSTDHLDLDEQKNTV